MSIFNNLENKTPSDTYGRFQLVCMNVQPHSSLEPPLEYNQDQTPPTNQGMSRLEFLEKFPAKMFCFVGWRRQQHCKHSVI